MSADLIGASTDLGLHVALGTSVTAGSGTQPTPVTAGGGSNPQTTTTPADAIQQLEAGGDFYIKGILPVIDWAHPTKSDVNQQLMIAFIPRMAFNFQGFGSQNTITEATEENWNASFEGNYNYPLIPDAPGAPVSFYIDGKTGYQGVQGAFAREVGLGHQVNFMLSELAAGFDFNGFRIGFQRFIGPAAAFGQQGNPKLATWHLAVQFSPSSKAK